MATVKRMSTKYCPFVAKAAYSFTSSLDRTPFDLIRRHQYGSHSDDTGDH